MTESIYTKVNDYGSVTVSLASPVGQEEDQSLFLLYHEG